LGPDGRQGVWTYTAWVVDLAGNQSATSNTLAISVDTVAPDAPVLDLPADQDSGTSSSDNITNVNYWRVVSGSANETARGFLHELSPNGRELTGGAYNANLPGWGFGGTFAPAADAAGGLGADGRQGVWTYTAWVIDLAGNQSATSNPLAITFDTVAPTGDFSLAGTVINGQLATATTSEAVTLAYSEGPVEYSISTDGGATTTAFAPYA